MSINANLNLNHILIFKSMSFTSYQSSFYMRDYYRKALLVLMREKLWWTQSQWNTSTAQLLHLRLTEHHKRRDEKILRASGPGSLCETVSPKNERKDTHSTSKAWLLKQYLKKDNMNRRVWCGKSFCICCVYWLIDKESDLSCDRVE